MTSSKIRSFIPNVVTLCNLCCGFMALIQDDLWKSAAYIILGMIFDILDGLIARALHTSSELGKQLDSLADMVTFGLVPAYLYYNLADDPALGIAAGFMLTIASALRLGKFNLIESKGEFQGLPTPAATAILVGIFIAYSGDQELASSIIHNPVVYILIPFFISVFMISNVNMFSLKEGFLSIRRNPGPVLCVLVLVSMMFINKEMAILTTSIFYICLSLVFNVIKR